MTTSTDARPSARGLAAAIVALAALAATPAAAQLYTQTVTVADTACTSCDRTTALGNAVCPRGNTVALASATRYAVDAFTLAATTNVSVNRVLVRIEPPSAYTLIERIEIRSADASMTTLYGSKSPVSDLEMISLAQPIPVTGAATAYRIAVVPRIHLAMPLPASGALLPVRAVVNNVTTYEAGTAVTNTDTGSATVEIDNAGPADITLTGVTRAANSLTFNWTAGNELVFLRRLAGPVGDVPAEGTTACGTTGTCDVKQGTTYGTSSSYVAFYGGTTAATFPDGSLTTDKPYYYKAFSRDACGNYSAGLDIGPIYPGTIAEGDTTNNTGKPVVGIISPAPGAAAAPVRAQVRAFSPNGVALATAADAVRIIADNGSTAAPVVASGTGVVSVPTQFNLTKRTAYVNGADNGVYEYSPDAGATWPGLNLAPGTWTLRAYARNGLACTPTPTCQEVYSGAVGLIVNVKGDGRLLVRDNSDQMCSDCHATKTHSAESVGTGLGSWYVGCRTCHQPHGTTNASLVATEVRPPALNQTLPPQKVTYLGAGSESTSDGKGLCQVCHTETTFYQRNVANETHGDGQECSTCHKHEDGQKTECTSCHGDPARGPVVAGADTLVLAAPPLSASPNAALRSLATEPSVGEHVAHVNQATYTSAPVHCDECHKNATHQNMTLGGGGNGLNVDMVWGTIATRDGASPLWNRVTCQNTYCHGATLVTFAGPPSGSNPNPSWISGANGLTCTSCHASPPTIAQTGHPPNATCTTCHAGYSATALPANKSTHIDGTIQTPPSYCAKCHGDLSQTTVDLATNLNWAAPGVIGTGGTTSYDVAGSGTTARAGIGAHAKHLGSPWSTPGGSASCGQCHAVPSSNIDRLHAQGGGTNANTGTSTGSRATLTWNSIATGHADPWNSSGTPTSPGTFTPPEPAYTGSTTQANGTTGGTCANVYCHGAFKNSGKSSPTVTWASATPTAMHCNSCHGTSSTAGNATTPPQVSAGGMHPNVVAGTDCSGCHPGGYGLQTVNPLTHIDGILQANPVSTATKCTDCHGDNAATPRTTPLTTSDGFGGQLGLVSPPSDARDPRSVTETSYWVGAHQPHVNQSATAAPPSGGAAGAYRAPMTCTECHSSIPTQLLHAAIPMSTNTASRATGLGAGSSYTAATASTSGACNSSYCHGNWTYGKGAQTVQWGNGTVSSATKMTCTSCHGATTAVPGYPHPQNTTCATCHTGYTATSINPATHVNRATNKSTYGCSACHGVTTTASPGVATGANPVNAAPGIVGARDSAGNVETDTARGGVGAHRAHLVKANFRSAAITCDQCHSVPNSTTQYPLAEGGTGVTHADGTGGGASYTTRATLTWGPIATNGGAVSPSYTGSQSKASPTGAGGSCQATYCHGNFVGGQNAAPSWSGAWNATTTVCASFPCATTSLTCASCHGSGTNAYPAHPHPANATCGNCHSGYATTALNLTAKGTHMNRAIDKTSNGCSSCHGVIATLSPGVAVAADLNPINAAPGVTGAAYDTTGATSGKAVGAHAAHLNNSKLRTQKVVCTDCHLGNAALAVASTDRTHTTDAGTGGARAAVAFSSFVTSDHRATPGTILNVAYAGSTTGSTDAGAGACNNTYCHGGSSPKGATQRALSGGSMKNPSWTAGAAATATCDLCHGAPPTLKGDGTAHSTGTNCASTSCHGAGYDAATPLISGTALTTHIDGQIQSGGGGGGGTGCTGCHGDTNRTSPLATLDPLGVAIAKASPPTDSRSTATTSNWVGAHQQHVSQTATPAFAAPIDCVTCHGTAVSTYTTAPGPTAHGNGTATVPFSGYALATGSAYTAATASTQGSCSATYCHGNFTGGAGTAAIQWGTGVTSKRACTACHSNVGGASPALSQRHTKHINNGTTNYAFGCATCHAATVSNNTTIGTPGSHVNGQKNVAFGTIGTVNQSTGQPPVSQGACNATYCHSQGTATSSFPAPNRALTWSAGAVNAACDDCHGGNATATFKLSTGAHTAHVNQTVTGVIGCASCHANTVSADRAIQTDTRRTNHVNGAKDVTATTWDGVAKTCNTNSCHNSGQRTSPQYYQMTWGTPTAENCKTCHGRWTGTGALTSAAGEPNYPSGGAFPSTTANSHAAHVTSVADCNKCHSTTVNTSGTITGNHLNGTGITVQLATTYAGTWDGAAKTCSSLIGGCHTGTRTWGQTGVSTCLSCHSTPQPGTGSAASATGVALSGTNRAQILGLTTTSTTNADGDDFVRASRHVSNGTANSTTANIVKNVDCILCHAEGSTTSTETAVVRDNARHGGTNNRIHLRDVDSDAGSGVAALWPGTRKKAFTANSFERDQMDWFCMGCHDGDGAAGVSVNSTNTGFATSPAIVATNIARTSNVTTVTAPNTLVVNDRVNLTSAIANAGGTAADFSPGIKTVASATATQFTYSDTGANVASRAVTASFRRYVAVNAGSMTRTTSTVTVNTVTPHGFVVGDVVALTPGEDTYRGGWKTIATATASSFTYSETIATAPAASTKINYFVKTSARAKTPFNTADTLQNARETGTHSVRAWRTTNNKIINVKSQFNSDNLSGSNYAAHHNLNQFTKRYGTSSLTTYVSAFRTKDNAALSDTVGLHCSDCHLNETNAHGSRNTWYMLASSAAGTYNDYDVAPAGGGSTTDNNVCGRCHNAGVYAYTGGTSTGAGSVHQRCTRLDDFNAQMRLGTPYTTSYGAATIPCLGCHGGNGATNLGPGLIHGTNEIYAPNNTTAAANKIRMYRFMGSGGTYRYYSPNNTQNPGTGTAWSTAGSGSCYNLASGTVGADTWGACTNHTGDQTITTNARRGLDY